MNNNTGPAEITSEALRSRARRGRENVARIYLSKNRAEYNPIHTMSTKCQ
jgi:hypothetical protein